MIYVAYYRNAKHQLCVRKISRGFACTTMEMPREMKTRCRASNTPIWDYWDTHNGADCAIERAVRQDGYINETGKE